MPPLDDASDLGPVYEEAGRQQGIDPDLLRAQTQVESSDNDYAVSPAGAEGRSQFIPSTARRMGLQDPYDAREAIPAQARLLRENMDRFGDPTLAVGAYHGGENMRAWGPKTDAYMQAVAAAYARRKQSRQNSDKTPTNSGIAGVGDVQARAATARFDPSKPFEVEPTQPAQLTQQSSRFDPAKPYIVEQTQALPMARTEAQDKAQAAPAQPQTLPPPLGAPERQPFSLPTGPGRPAPAPQRHYVAEQEAEAAGKVWQATKEAWENTPTLLGSFGAKEWAERNKLGEPRLLNGVVAAFNAAVAGSAEAANQIGIGMGMPLLGRDAAAWVQSLGMTGEPHVPLGRPGMEGPIYSDQLPPGTKIGVGRPPEPAAPGTPGLAGPAETPPPEPPAAPHEPSAATVPTEEPQTVVVKPQQSVLDAMAAEAEARIAARTKAAQEAPPPEEAAHDAAVEEEHAGLAEIAKAHGVEPPAATDTGTTRFYHGGADYAGGPRWLTPDLKYAQGYAAKSGSGVSYVDIPNDSPLLNKTFDDTGTDQTAPFASFEAPAEIAARLKPLGPPSVIAMPGPAQPAAPLGLPAPAVRPATGPQVTQTPPVIALPGPQEAPAEAPWDIYGRPVPGLPPDSGTPEPTQIMPEAMQPAASPETIPEAVPPETAGNRRKPSAAASALAPTPKEPERLSSFLRRIGGVKDAGGDIRSSLGGTRFRPGLINNKAGVPLDEAALRAWEAGYFPELGDERPDINQLLNALDDDLNLAPRYSHQDEGAVAAYQDAHERNAEIVRLAAEHDIEAQGKTSPQFFDELHDKLSADEHAREMQSQADAHEAAYREAEKAAKQFVAQPWHARDFYGVEQTRTLKDLEDEHQQETAASAARERAPSGEEPRPTGGDQSEVPRGGGPRAGGAGDGLSAEAQDHPQAQPAGSILPLVEHTTKRGKVLRGTIRTDLNRDQARAIDPYSFRKDGGWFIRDTAQTAPAAEVAPPATEAPRPAAVADDSAGIAQRRAAQVERMRDQAKRLENEAKADEARDRQANTPRRARMAASASDDARARQQIAMTMHNLADAIEAGDAPHLVGVSTRAAVEQLDSIARQAHYARMRAENVSYGDQEKGQPITEADIRYAKMPDIFLHTGWEKDAATAIERVAKRGHATLINWLRHSRGEGTFYPTPEQREQFRSALADVRKKTGTMPHDLKRIAEGLADYDRLAKINIKTPDDLRAALTEYLQFRGGRKTEGSLARAERELVGQKPGTDFFPTPRDLAARMIEEADIEPGMRVLEPSAGKGDLADAAREAGAQVDTVEMSDTLRNLLEAKGHSIVGRDFMEFTPTEAYDRVVMNPPFSDNMDAAHVQRAYEMLKPGGRLVAITGEGVHFRTDRVAAAFRRWMEDHGAQTEKLPEGSFKSGFRPTGAATRLLVVDKPAATDGTADLLGKPVAAPRDHPQPEPTIRNDARQEAMPGMEPSAVQAQAARDAEGRGALQADVPQKAADEGLFAPDTSGQGTLYSFPGALFDPEVWRRTLGPLAGPTRAIIGKSREITQSIANDLSPMQGGTKRAQNFAATFANALRQIQFRFGEIDRGLEHDFTPNERTKMGAALDAQSVFEQQVRDLPEDQQARARADFDATRTGLAGLTPKQRQPIEAINLLSEDTWEQMRERGLVAPNARGIPYYFPRQILLWTEEQGFTRPGAGAGTRGIDQLGINLTTAGPGRREHLTPEETEEAARAKFGNNAAILRDIRSLPARLAYSLRAVAGVDLIDKIGEIGQQVGSDLVAHGELPREGQFFTIADHPSFRRWTGTGWQPTYVAKEFEGPLRAVLTQPPSAWYRGAMTVKSALMTSIMWSPLIHLQVEFGRSAPIMLMHPVTTATSLWKAPQLRRDLAYMDQATTDGLAPLGRAGWRTDPVSIADQANVEGHNRYIRAMTEYRDAVAKGAGKVGGRFVEDVLRHPHQTLLWDQVFNLQVGLYDALKKEWTPKFGPEVAGTMAAHIANRYAGALPPEHLSRVGNMLANLLLFSRSFTLGNLGVMKDMFNGAPSHVRARIEHMAGPEMAKSAKGALQRKAISAFVMDIGMYMAGGALFALGIQAMRGWLSSDDSLPKAVVDTYKDWLDKTEYSLKEVAHGRPEKILGVLPQMWNEPGKQGRVYVGNDSQGQGIYLRLPFGKVGEEFIGWSLWPGTMLMNKMRPEVRPIIESIFGKDSLGRDIYRPEPETIGDRLRIAGEIVKHIGASLGPTSAIEGVKEMFQQHVLGQQTRSDPMVSAAKVLGPATGLATISKGFPGGPAAGEMHAQGERERYDLNKAMPGIREKIRTGDIEGAVEDMSALNVSPGLQRYYLRQTMQPGLSRGAMRRLPNAPPDIQERVRRQLGQ